MVHNHEHLGLIVRQDKVAKSGTIYPFNTAYNGNFIGENFSIEINDCTPNQKILDFVYYYQLSFPLKKVKRLSEFTLDEITNIYFSKSSLPKIGEFDPKFQLIYFCNKLFANYYNNELTKDYKNILENIDSYHEKFNFEETINNYKLKLNYSHSHKAGDDDSFSVDIINEPIQYPYHIDPYIVNLLPKIYVNRLDEIQFRHWMDIKSDYEEGQKRIDLIYLDKLEQTIKFRAKSLYSKEDHKLQLKGLINEKMRELINMYLNRVNTNIKDLYIMLLTRYLDLNNS